MKNFLNFSNFVNESAMTQLKSQYDIEHKKDKKNNDQIVVQLKSKNDFPYRIVEKDKKFIVSKGYSERSYIPIKFQKKKELDSLEKCYEYIVKQHNTSVEYMPGAKAIKPEEWEKSDKLSATNDKTGTFES